MDYDIILFEKNDRLCCKQTVRLPIEKNPYKTTFIFNNSNYNFIGQFGEWLAVCNGAGCVIGVSLVCCTRPAVEKQIRNLNNVITNNGNEYTVIFHPDATMLVDGWPLLPVLLFQSVDGAYILYVTNFYEDGQGVAVCKNISFE